MHVKIIQSQSGTWYDDFVGNEYKVIDKKITSDPEGDYLVTMGGGVFCTDYIEVNRYPTLKSDYSTLKGKE